MTSSGARVLLLHPPLLSPAVWGRAAAALVQRGHEPLVPTLRWDQVDRWWQGALGAVLAAVESAGWRRVDLVVAHSGAGALVPVVVDALPGAPAVVLVDALLPGPSGGWTTVSPAVRALVADLTEGDVLPPWTRWWGPTAMAELVPDPVDREALETTAPRLPLGFFDVAVPVPVSWPTEVRAYVRLSGAYDREAQQARAAGWHVVERDGSHLDVLTAAGAVVETLLEVARYRVSTDGPGPDLGPAR